MCTVIKSKYYPLRVEEIRCIYTNGLLNDQVLLLCVLRPPYTAKVSGTCFWNSNTKQLGDLFQKQKIKGSLWNLCAVYAGLYN